MIADVHYNVHTLPLADNAMRQAIMKANKLNIPLIVAGDLHDTKANLRGECVNQMLKTFSLCETPCYILRGNHCSINEKSKEHSLNFLKGLAYIVDDFHYASDLDIYMMAYQHNPDDARRNLKSIPTNSIVIMHQGIQGHDMGDYIQDKSAINMIDIEGLKVHSGHYHYRNDIYIGNPYTISFGEANDPEKGFKVLHTNGSAEFIPTQLRKHTIVNMNAYAQYDKKDLNSGDLLWVKVTCLRSDVSRFTKDFISMVLSWRESFKLTYEFLDTKSKTNTPKTSQSELFDSLIDNMSELPETKLRLKDMWKTLVSLK